MCQCIESLGGNAWMPVTLSIIEQSYLCQCVVSLGGIAWIPITPTVH